MDYELLLFILGTIIFSGVAIYGFKALRKNGYTKSDIENTLTTTHLIVSFTTMALSRKLNDSYKAMYYSDLIIRAIDYLKLMIGGIPLERKIDEAMVKIFSTGSIVGVKLTDIEKAIIRDVLITAYELHLSLENRNNK